MRVVPISRSHCSSRLLYTLYVQAAAILMGIRLGSRLGSPLGSRTAGLCPQTLYICIGPANMLCAGHNRLHGARGAHSAAP